MSNKNKTPEAVNQFLEDKQIIADKAIYESPEGWVNAYELYKRETKSYNYLVDNLLLKSGISTIYGVEDTGKSQLALFLLLKVVGDNDFLGKKINAKHKKALLITTEDQEEDIEVRLHNMVDNSDYLPESLSRVYTRYSAKDIIPYIKKFVNKQKVDLVVIDCFGDIFPHDLKQLNHTRVWLQEFYELTTTYKFHLMFVHHSKKDSEEKPPHKSNCSGVGLTAKGRTSIEFRKDPEDLLRRHICIVKANHLSEELKQDSIEIEFDHGNFNKTGSKQFDMLVISKDEKEALQNNVLKLDAEKKTQEQIAEKLDLKQYQVSRILKRAKHQEKYKNN